MIKFESRLEYIDEQIARRRNKWNLNGLGWMDFDDVSQIIRTHIYVKWGQWDQEQPLGPWVNKVISNQIRNIIRNNYKNCSKDLTEKQKDRQEQKKNVRMPLSWEFHFFEISNRKCDEIPLESIIEEIKAYMKDEVEDKYYKAFLMLYFSESSEEDVAKFLGYKSNEPKRKAGYKQIRNLKNMFKEKVLKILREQDIAGYDAFK